MPDRSTFFRRSSGSASGPASAARMDSRWNDDNVLFPRDTCVTCDGSTPTCNCASDESCVLTSRTCSQCPTIVCNKIASSSGSSINPGAIAGPVVAVLVIASCALFWWLRRKKRRDLARLEELAARARKAESAGFHLSSQQGSQPGSPARSARSGRSANSNTQYPAQPHAALRASSRSPLPPAPVNAEYYDENGATFRVYTGNGTINLDPKHPDNMGSDPFSDRQSVSTAGSMATSSQSTNIIPIQYIPPSKSDDTLTRFFHSSQSHESGESGGGGGDNRLSHAAKTLDQARQNLFRPKGQQVPQRPARAPGLDLRAPQSQLQASANAGGDGRLSPLDERSPTAAFAMGEGARDSYLSNNSGAPSFLSGSTDLYVEAPKIMTSKQVQIGRLQQAEVVQFGKTGVETLGQHGSARLSPSAARADANPFEQGNAGPSRVSPSLSAVRPYLPINTAGSVSGSGSGSAPGSGARTLTPSTGRRFESTEGDYDEYEYSEPSPISSGDLRFSMGSLARDSISSMGTSRYLARPESGLGAVPSPRSPSNPNHNHNHAGGQGSQGPTQPHYATHGSRESIASGKSYADSVLGAFPMFPPGHEPVPPLPHSTSGFGIGIPQSTSMATLDAHSHMSHMAHPPPMPPPTSFKSVAPGPVRRQNSNGPPKSRPVTAASVADSFLGTFPFVPPNMDDMAELPSATIPETAGVARTGVPLPTASSQMSSAQSIEGKKAGRLTLGMSTTSEGLGDFDFSFDRDERPPMPGAGPSGSQS